MPAPATPGPSAGAGPISCPRLPTSGLRVPRGSRALRALRPLPHGAPGAAARGTGIRQVVFLRRAHGRNRSRLHARARGPLAAPALLAEEHGLASRRDGLVMWHDREGLIAHGSVGLDTEGGGRGGRARGFRLREEGFRAGRRHAGARGLPGAPQPGPAGPPRARPRIPTRAPGRAAPGWAPRHRPGVRVTGGAGSRELRLPRGCGRPPRPVRVHRASPAVSLPE